MAASRTPILSPAERVLVITRVFDAPRELVFKAWTDARLARNWWGPRDYPAVELEMDARPGGTWRGRLRSVETGQELPLGGVFREIVAPDRIVFTFKWDEEGERGLETLVTVAFAEQGGKTLMTFRHEPFQSVEERDGHRGGWGSSFDRLADYVTHAAASER